MNHQPITAEKVYIVAEIQVKLTVGSDEYYSSGKILSVDWCIHFYKRVRDLSFCSSLNSRILHWHVTLSVSNEPPRGKTNNVVSKQVRQKSGCTVTEAG